MIYNLFPSEIIQLSGSMSGPVGKVTSHQSWAHTSVKIFLKLICEICNSDFSSEVGPHECKDIPENGSNTSVKILIPAEEN